MNKNIKQKKASKKEKRLLKKEELEKSGGATVTLPNVMIHANNKYYS